MRAVRAAAIGLGLVLVLLVAQSEAQSATKFGSDSLLPPGYAAKQLEKPSNKNIWVSAALVRLLSVSDISFSFDSIVGMSLSWNDPRAYDAMRKATIKYRTDVANSSADADCEVPCSNDAIIPSPDPDFFGDSDYLCCDGVFLPAVSVLNAQSPDKIFVKSYSIGFVDGDEPGVQYKLEIQGSYFTQMSFKMFPFDTQRLNIHVGGTFFNDTMALKFIPSARSTRWWSTHLQITSLEGEKEWGQDHVAGWIVGKLQINTWISNIKQQIDYMLSYWGVEPAPKDPFAISENGTNGGASGRVYSGFTVATLVSRSAGFYILNLIMPVMLLNAVSLLTYFIHPMKFEHRMGLNVTLFLSLTAIKFVASQDRPKSSYPTPMTKIFLVSYAMIGFAIPESILVHTLNSQMNKNKEKQIKKEEEEAEEASHPSSSPKSATENTPTVFAVDLEGGLPKTPKKKGGSTLIRRLSRARTMSVSDFAKYSMGESKWARKLKGTDMPISRAAIVIDMCAAAAVCTVFVATTCVFLIPPNPGPNYDSFM